MNYELTVSNVSGFASVGRTQNTEDGQSQPIQLSSAQDDKIPTQPPSICVGDAAAASPPVISPHETADPTSVQAQLRLMQQRVETSGTDRCRNDVIAATIDVKSSLLTKYSFPLELQDPILSARRYRIVEELGKGCYGKVFLAWDERRL